MAELYNKDNSCATSKLFTVGEFAHRGAQWVIEAEQPYSSEEDTNYAQIIWLGADDDQEYPGARMVLSELFADFDQAVERAKAMFADIPATIALLEGSDDAVAQRCLRHYEAEATRPEEV